MSNHEYKAARFTNRAYAEMLKSAKDRLLHRSPEEISSNAQVTFDKEASHFVFESLGQKVFISYPEYDLKNEPDAWFHLIVLHYFDLANGTPLSPELITFIELPDGFVRGQGFDRQSEGTIGGFFGNKPPQAVQKTFAAMGADFIESNADICAVMPFLPLYPITVKVWFADDEMPGSGKMLLNKSARHYLAVEDAVIVGGMLLDALIERYERNC